MLDGMLKYYDAYQSAGIIYSCDMIRLKFVFIKDVSSFSLDWMYNMSFRRGYHVDNYKSNKLSGYRDVFVLTRSDDNIKAVITLGFFCNKADTAGNHSNFIEFNPNKVDMNDVMYLLIHFSGWSSHITSGRYYELVRYDMAVDVPVSRSYVKLLKSGKRTYTRIQDTSLTEYLGKRNSNGFVKVYDKTAESDLYYDLTRIEITCDSLSPTLPDVYIKEYQTSLDFEFELNNTDKVLVELLRRCDDNDIDYFFKQLGRSKREKLKSYVYAESNMFKFDKLGILHVTMIVDDIINMNVKGVEHDKIIKQLTVPDEQCTETAAQPVPDWAEMIPREDEM